MSGRILLTFPKIPVSVNKLYFTRGGRRIKSSAAQKFINAFVSSRGGVSAGDLMKFSPDHEDKYALHLWFFLSPDKLYNRTYGTDGRVKSPFRDMDTSNLIKLAEDSIAKLLGMRDRNNWTVCAHKREAEDQEFMVALVVPLDYSKEEYPCPKDSTTDSKH